MRLQPTLLIKILMSDGMRVEPSELRATVTSFAIAFLLMASYFVLRPVRDAMASDWTDTELSVLWNLQFFASLTLISSYGWMVSNFSLARIVPLVYLLFAVTFIAFWVLLAALGESKVADKLFYLWVSLFSLLHISIFWSLVSERFSKEQSTRLFPIAAAGASAGAIVGPLIPAVFAKLVGLNVLLLISACGVFAVVPLVLILQQQTSQRVATGSRNADQIGGRWWQGFHDLVNNRYLFYIALFLLLYVFIGSFVYFIQKNLLAEFSRPERAQILGVIDWLVNSITFVMAFFVTGRMVSKLGMPSTLALVPILLCVAFLALAFAPLVVLVLALQVARRAGNYAITRPAREMLFSTVSQEQRFKTKPVIDVGVYRGGDAVSGTLFAFLSDGLGMGLAALALIASVISGAWALVALFLGRIYQQGEPADLTDEFPGKPSTTPAKT